MKKHSFQRQNILIIGIFCLIVQVIHAPPIELKNLNFKPDNYKLGTDGIAVVFGGKDTFIQTSTIGACIIAFLENRSMDIPPQIKMIGSEGWLRAFLHMLITL